MDHIFTTRVIHIDIAADVAVDWLSIECRCKRLKVPYIIVFVCWFKSGRSVSITVAVIQPKPELQ